jgi:Ca2+-binding EF-hand superfamily protein
VLTGDSEALVRQVLMECKDAEGVQKFITVPATMNWTELLQKLKHKYGRAVTFMYEADGHSYTVNDERDFKQCWDSAEDAFLRANPVTPSAHLEAFIINIDPSKILGRAGGMRAGRKAHLQPKRVTLGEVRDERVSRPEGAARREAQRQEFDSQHQRIDDMLRKTGAGDSEPSSMRKKWDKLLHECASIDTKKEKTLSQENFKKALLKADPNMTPDQQGWYVKDADKNSSGEILYEKYCEQKKTGKSVREGEAVQNDTIRQLERQISQAFKDRYKTLQSAFKRLDEDKDGY